MVRQGRDRLELGPVLACVTLALCLGAQFLLPYSEPPPDGGALAARHPRLIALPLLAEYPAILHAPVFAPDRRPGETGAPAPGGGALDGYAALGAATGGGVATAVVSGPGGAARTVRRGESVEGWRLVAVDRARLTFERDGVRHVLVIGAPAQVLSKAAEAPPADEP